MPTLLTGFSINDPFTTPLGWQVDVIGPSYGALLYISVDCDTPMNVYTPTGDFLVSIPAWTGFLKVRLWSELLYIEFRPGTPLNQTAGPTSIVTVMYFGPNEYDPQYPTVGLLRQVNIGNTGAITVTATTTNVLQGVLQLYGVTEAGNNTDNGPTLLPANVSQSLRLCATDVNGARLGGLNILTDGTLGLLGLPRRLLTPSKNETLVALGFPALVGTVDAQAVTTIGVKTLISYTTPNDGANHTYRVHPWADIQNAVSGNNIAFQVLYTRPNGTARTTALPLWSATAVTVFSGSVAIANGVYEGMVLEFTAKPNTTITIQYNDPTNTPNDSVSAVLERIS